MKTSPLRDPEYRPTFSGHETFPLRYGWLQKAYEAVAEAESEKDAVHVFRDPSSIARFGVGRNMVSSMRYWAYCTEIIGETQGHGLTTCWLGDLLFGTDGLDHYLEEAGSLWLLHWKAASDTRLTTLFWLFNEFGGGTFARKDVVSQLMTLARAMDWPRVSEVTVDRDAQCLLRTYVGGRGGSEAGDSILSELGLVRPLSGGRFSLVRGLQASLPNSVFLFAVCDFWQQRHEDRATLSYEALAFEAKSPGRVFLLDDASLIDRLEALEELTGGALVWSETAGLRQLVRHRELSFEDVTPLIQFDFTGANARSTA